MVRTIKKHVSAYTYGVFGVHVGTSRGVFYTFYFPADLLFENDLDSIRCSNSRMAVAYIVNSFISFILSHTLGVNSSEWTSFRSKHVSWIGAMSLLPHG